MLKRFILLAFVATLAACAGQSPVKEGLDAATENVSKNPRIALRQLEERLLEAEDKQKALIQLKIVELQLQQGQDVEAGQTIQQIDQKQLTLNQRVQLMLFKANQVQTTETARDAVKFLPKNKPQFPPELQIRVLRTQAQILNAAGYTIESIHARVNLQRLLTEQVELENNAKYILQGLSALPGQSLQQLADKHLSDDMDSWTAFVIATKPQLFSLSGFEGAVIKWQELYPEHSIPTSIIDSIRNSIHSKENYPSKVALLLPLSGKFARQAESIRDGFLAAFYNYEGTDKPEIFILDNAVASLPVEQQLLFAKQQGAGLVVGPLTKRSIQQVDELDQLPLPVLALNYLDKKTPDAIEESSEEPVEQPVEKSGFYQFGLLPEDEAVQAAQLALLRDQTKAALMVPKTSLGKRMASAFTDAFESNGGKVLSVQEYDSKAKDFSRSIKSMLNVQQSLSRKSILQTVLASKIEFTPRIRQDIDVIYMVAPPSQARGIKPQLKFHDAGDIPVLANSQLFNGISNPTLDKDINGVVFTQTPWLLKANETPLHQQLKALWPASMARNSKLYALGADAFNLIPFLGRLQQDEQFHKDGYTGTLSAGSNGRIHRQLLWAKFEKGLVQLEDNAILEMENMEMEAINTESPEASDTENEKQATDTGA